MNYNKKFFIFLILCLFLSILLFIRPAYSESAEQFYYKANLSLTSGKMNEAVTLYKAAIGKKPDFFEAYLGLSIAYRELEDYNKAHEAIVKVLQIRPDYNQVYYNLGLILEKQDKPEEAVRAYQVFLDKVPGAARFTDVKQRIQKLKK